MPKAKKLLFVVAEDWYFCSHRLSLAIAAKSQGYEVSVATRVHEHASSIEDAGIKLIPLIKMRRSSTNVLKEMSSIIELIKIYRDERPDIVHQVALKPVLYGSIAARITGVPRVVSALGGLGFVFSSKKLFARVLRPVVTNVFRFFLDRPNSRLIVQNEDDLNTLNTARICSPARMRLIRGAGVDLDLYETNQVNSDVPIVMLASRMLWDKGIGEFVEAARMLKAKKLAARFVLVGDTDKENPTAISPAQMKEWNDSNVIEWWGYRKDMPAILKQAEIVCLPSYYEGLPKVLLEAMASARPIITTDTCGCRDLVRDEENGLLVPLRDAKALAHAIEALLVDRIVARKMGIAGRAIVEKEFGMKKIADETLNVYRELGC